MTGSLDDDDDDDDLEVEDVAERDTSISLDTSTRNVSSKDKLISGGTAADTKNMP